MFKASDVGFMTSAGRPNRAMAAITRSNGERSSEPELASAVYSAAAAAVAMAATAIPVVASGEALHRPPPRYPILARRQGWEGTVILTLVLTADGAVRTVNITTSSGHACLDESACRAVSAWRFPAADASQRRCTVSIRFDLRTA